MMFGIQSDLKVASGWLVADGGWLACRSAALIASRRVAGGCYVGGGRDEKPATHFSLWQTNEQCEIPSCYIKIERRSFFFTIEIVL